MGPASVAAAQNPTGVMIAPDGNIAYVLSACVDTSCDGEVTQYTIGATGGLTATSASQLLGTHVIPMTLVTSLFGPSAYLLTNFMGVDTETAAVQQYAINAGDLRPDSPLSPQISPGVAIAEAINGSDLYVLATPGIITGPTPSPSGANVDHYMIDSTGLLTLVDTTAVAPGHTPAAITVVPAQ
jgi:hypothetical protein